jgi:hypothetical protein
VSNQNFVGQDTPTQKMWEDYREMVLQAPDGFRIHREKMAFHAGIAALCSHLGNILEANLAPQQVTEEMRKVGRGIIDFSDSLPHFGQEDEDQGDMN